MIADHYDWAEFKNLVRVNETALLVIDVQNDFCADGGWQAKSSDVSMIQSMVPTLNKFFVEARAQRVLIILIRSIYDDHIISPMIREKNLKRGRDPLLCVENTWGADFYTIKPEVQDIIVTKHRHSAFLGTELDFILRNYGIKTLILSGVATNVCVDTTARDGFARGYNIVFLSDCTATWSERLHNSTLENISRVFGLVCTSKQVMEAWECAKNSAK
jgi:ureidoacrylate peracid hydrolase